ncbi:oxygen-independent coproporphyrinogen III oxidase [Marivibrio halodurans]|uniref:Coproporphyrinogen-III oxidase n=1 Tax=Marivibrio halodurans TaxID=2039722 RepID=A0A8J7RZN8_9PROT|nr:oxygen-independent coproporphyrinogen III oxidase [Marivibrio halodurans]MBP5857245.1 oxygen-independent coproporphyrinogen III oxidase [Marivibrio halodurans]
MTIATCLPPKSPDLLLSKYGGPVPRYTSYPTAPHFDGAVDAALYREWLGQLPADRTVSLYFHIPFCDTLCWFCGCQTKITKRYEPVAAYLDRLDREIAMVREAAGGARLPVAHIHWGGGSPTLLVPDDIGRLARMIDRDFARTEDCEFAVEIDPRDIGPATVDALADAGVTRASLGLQDADPAIQHAINRVQPLAETAALVEELRIAGVRSLNLDLMYGLPHQTTAHVLATIDQALRMEPDRIALFGYAHVPWMRPHQRMIPEAALPGPSERLAQAQAAAAALMDAGFVPIGFDHFARPDDPMARALARGALRRNFQGYTTDGAETLIGIGASAIGRLPQGYVQNDAATGRYLAAIDDGAFATARGHALSGDDRLMGAAIERLLCDFEVDLPALAHAHGKPADAFTDACARLAPMIMDGLVLVQAGRLIVSDSGRPFVRRIAACFDAYLGTPAPAAAATDRAPRHSVAV